MSSTARPRLAIDDPLAPRSEERRDESARVDEVTSGGGAEEEPIREGAERKPVPSTPAAAPGSRHADEPETTETGLWREWGGGSRVASYRLPDELLDELDERTRPLGLPIGLTVAAAMLELLDRDDAAITDLVDRVDDARHHARRAARRRR